MFSKSNTAAGIGLRKLAVGLLAGLLLLPAAPGFARAATTEGLTCDSEVNLLLNGSFETPEVTDEENWDVFPSPVDNWIVEWLNPTPEEGKPEVGYLELQVAGYYASADGDQFAELDSNWQGPGGTITSPHDASVRIYQDIATIPGATYSLSFAFSARPGYDANDNVVEASWNGAAIDTVDADGTALTNTDWTVHTYEVVATGPVTRVQLSDAGTPNSFGTFLDNTSLRCTGTPETGPTPGDTACSDLADNDGDGKIDMEDPNCDSPADDNENQTGRGGGGGNSDDDDDDGSVLGASTSTAPEGQVLGDSCGLYITTFIKLGANNDVEDVKRLQTFLNENVGSTLPVTGWYGNLTMNALKTFQVKYKDDVLTPWANYGLTADEAVNGTGYVYKTTQRWINMIKCEELKLPVPQLP